VSGDLTGRSLAGYQITAKLGEGGMGEVWRARDTKLDRDVAIKVLPAAFVEDAERLARFEREAKVLAQLNHPNIAHIYGLEASGDSHALVLELVEGPTLAERLERGPLPLEESLALARQIAEALEEAHEKGIVHRDLKPQNIKASNEGKVKVLDFGLAKAMDPTAAASGAGSVSQLAQSPTLTLGATLMGVVLGTAAYMSPEQAKGFAVDKRADVWSFGVVLYEMLTGVSPFVGDSVPDTLARVLQRDVDLGALPEAVPPAIRQLLRRCLERNPKNRLHDVADARLVIDDVVSGRLDGMVSLAAPESVPGPLWRRALPWAVAVLAIAWAVATWLGATRVEPEPQGSGVAFTVPWKSDHAALSVVRAVELSRDGRRLVIWDSLANGFVVRDLEDFESRTIPATEGAVNPALSPDGQWIAFSSEGELKKVALAGGDPVRLGELPSESPGIAWGADGFIYYTPTWNSGLWRIPEQGGSPERLTEPDQAAHEPFHCWPSLLPDGRSVLFTIFGSKGTADGKIALLDLATRKVTIVGPGVAARFVASGDLVYFRHGFWLAAPFDPSTGRLDGPERRVLSAARPLDPVGSKEQVFSFSTGGRLAYIAAPTSFSAPYSQLAWIDRSGEIERLPFEGAHSVDGHPLSPDDRRAAFTLLQEGEKQVWVYDLERGTSERWTRDGQNLNPAWSPDGSRLILTSLLRGNFDLRQTSADAPGLPVDVVGSPVDEMQAAWTPDGTTIVFSRASPETGYDLWVRRVDDAGPGRALVVTPHDDDDAEISPDGRWLLYRNDHELYVTSFPETGERTKIATGVSWAAWSPSTPELFLTKAGHLDVVRYETTGGRFRALESQSLFEVPPSWGLAFAVAHDAQRFLFFLPVPGRTLEPEVRVVTDGFAELRAKPESGR